MASKIKRKKSAWDVVFCVAKVCSMTAAIFATVFCALFGIGGASEFKQNEAQNVKPDAGEVIDLKALLSSYPEYDFAPLIASAESGDFISYALENGAPEEIIHICCALYNTANANYKNIGACAYEVNSFTTVITAGLEAPVSGYRYCLKNGEEYFYTEYSIPPEDSVIGAIMGAFVANSSNFALRRYGTVEMTQMVEQKALKPKHTAVDGKHFFEADWSKAVTNSNVDLPVFCASQDGEFSYTDIVISPATVKTATLNYDAALEIYTMKLNLDCGNPETTKNTLSNVRASSGCSDASYTSITEEIKIWDNGYFKYFLSVDGWKGTGNMGKMVSTINFETNFFYDSAHLDLANYQYGTEFKQFCEEA